MNNNQVPNGQNNFNNMNENIESLDTPINNGQVMGSGSQMNNGPQMGNVQNNFDPMTGQAIGNNMNVNPMPNSMPMQNQAFGPQQYNNGKKGNTGFIIIVVVLAVIILGLVLYIAFGDKIKSAFSKNTNDSEITDVNNGSNTGNDGNSVVDSNSTFTVDGVQFQIPQGYELKEENGQQGLVNVADQVVIMLFVHRNNTYSQYASATDQLKSSLEANGFVVSNNAEKTFGGKQWLVFEGTAQGTPVVDGFTALSSNSVLEFNFVSLSKSVTNEQMFGIANQMVTTAKDSNNSSFSKDESQNSQVKSSMTKFDTALLN